MEEIKKTQEAYFKAQIQLAKKLHLPFIIHSRESNTEVLEILKNENAQDYVFHCYSGNWEFAQLILKQNPQALF
jgi:TatD DNase family protein